MVSHGISWCEYNFFVSLLLHVKVLQFKLHLFYETPFLEIKNLNIANDQEKLPKYNLESHIKYQVTHKSCNGRIKIFGECFAVCQHFAVCFWCSTWQKCNICRVSFVYRASVFPAHGKGRLCRVPNSLPCAVPSTHGKGGVCRVPDIWHTAMALAHGNQAMWTIQRNYWKSNKLIWESCCCCY